MFGFWITRATKLLPRQLHNPKLLPRLLHNPAPATKQKEEQEHHGSMQAQSINEGQAGSAASPAAATTPRSKMAANDSLEYYIKFPQPNFNYNNGNASNGEAISDYVFVVNEDKLPVIILFGWAGCQDKYLAKYSQIYEEKGLITLRYIAPVKNLFWKRGHIATVGEKLVKLLKDLNFDAHPVIIHLFSNGGAFLYQNFMVGVEKHQLSLQIKGVILDSAPGRRNIVSLYRAISEIVRGRALYNVPVSILLTMFLSFVWMVELFADWLMPSQHFQHDPWKSLWNEKHRWPQHFVYSKSDNLIPYKDVEKFVEHRKSLGVDVTTQCYENSPHVKHYSHNRESYVSSVVAFVNKCLRN